MNKYDFKNVLSEKGHVLRDKLVMAFSDCGLRSNGKNLYDYDQQHGCWQVLGNERNRKLREMLPDFLRPKISSSLLASVSDDLVENPALYIDFRKNVQPLKLNLQNATFDLQTGQNVDRSQEDYFDYYINCSCLDLEKTEIADAPQFENFIRTSLAVDEVPERAKLLLQILGVAISSVSGIKKMVFLVGPSGSGKSVILRFIEHIIGSKHRSVLALTDMAQRFRLFDLEHARVNLCHEAQNSKIRSLDIIKKIVANEPILVEKKGIDAFEITPVAKLITAANCLPSLGEADNSAVIARMLLILFPNSIPLQEKDPALLNRLIAEKDIIVTLAIRELRVLMQNNFTFAAPEPEQAYLETYAQSENAVKAFLGEECVKTPEARIHYKDLFQVFGRYCCENNLRPLPDQVVKQFILGQPGIRAKKFRANGRNLWGLEGIGLIGNTFTRIPESSTDGGWRNEEE